MYLYFSTELKNSIFFFGGGGGRGENNRLKIIPLKSFSYTLCNNEEMLTFIFPLTAKMIAVYG